MQQKSLFTKLIYGYLERLHSVARQPDASPELSYRPALHSLLEGLPGVFEKSGFDLVSLPEPKREIFGTPDYKIKTAKGWLIGYVEAKGLHAGLREYEVSEQIKRYCTSGQRLLLTNHLEFTLFDTDPVAGNKAIHRVDNVQLLTLEELQAHRNPDPSRVEALRRLLDRFLREARPDINTPKELAGRLAAVARHTHDLLYNAYTVEDDNGDLHGMKNAFEATLIPDLSPELFVDMYAQTITYGLFAARCNHSSPDPFNLDTAWRDIPKTNPFLRRLFESVTGSALEDKPYRWIIEDLAHILAAINLETILTDFGKRTRQEDPVVHFYETFLAAYDPKLRKTRGVYYTPEPVVSYIVRSVDYLLKEKFDCSGGLANTDIVEVTRKDNAGNEKKETRHRVLILDPACGTGTFLYAVIEHIRQQFIKNNNPTWSDYVKRHILPRLFGFELLMAPYAVAHLKLGMQLAGQDLSEAQRADWVYDFSGDDRLGIYLTNSLEEAKRFSQLKLFWPRFIAEEASAAAQIKRDLPIMVVLGNPPYSGMSANMGKWIRNLVRDYYYVDGKPLGERNPKWLQDDYVKFIRFGQWRIQQTGAGILALITNHGYLDNPTFRGMRQQLMKSFTDIYIMDLHGNAKKKERCPDGSKDENVFDIQQGVAIGIFVKEPGKTGPAKVHHAELWGRRKAKYQNLKEVEIATTPWTKLSPSSPFYLFIPQNIELNGEYEQGWKITDAMPVNSVGIVTSRDKFVFDFEKDELHKRIANFLAPDKSDEAIKKNYLETRDKLNVATARKQILGNKYEEFFVKCLYRPFDIRYLFYHNAVIERSRSEVMRHMLAGENLGLITSRLTKGETFKHAQVTRNITEVIVMSPKTSNNGFLFPLYFYPNPNKPMMNGLPNGKNGRLPNLSIRFTAEMEKKLKLRFILDGGGDLKETFGPEDVFHYIYAVFHSPTYRSRYAECLKIDFPRLPLTSDLDLFRTLCARGADLVALHLLEDNYSAASWHDRSDDTPLQNTFTSYTVRGDHIVEKVEYKAPGEKVPGEDSPLTQGRVYINKDKPKEGKQAQYFDNVPPEVWEFHIGGYQVCRKWLKDRKGRSLSYDDVHHYRQMVAAMKETIRLMSEIDEAIPCWPIK